MATAATPSGRKTRKGRTAPTVQPSTDFISNNASLDTRATLRTQLLVERFALPVGMATLVAQLAWEVRSHG